MDCSCWHKFYNVKMTWTIHMLSKFFFKKLKLTKINTEVGFEPSTLRLLDWSLNQLGHRPVLIIRVNLHAIWFMHMPVKSLLKYYLVTICIIYAILIIISVYKNSFVKVYTNLRGKQSPFTQLCMLWSLIVTLNNFSHIVISYEYHINQKM